MVKLAAAFPDDVPRMSVVTTVVRTEWAQAIADMTRRLAYFRGSPDGVAQKVQGVLIHKVFHWMQRAGTHFLHQGSTMKRAERLAARLLDLEQRRVARERLRYGVDPLDDDDCRRTLTSTPYPRGPIAPDTWIKLWLQLTFEEQRVMQLVRQGFSLEEIALILDVTTHAAEFYRNQANRKIHKVYERLC